MCESETCSDGIKNQDETDIDCGGSCPLCEDGRNCSVDSDCISSWCYNGTCQTPSCSDGIQNQQEEGVDYGGPCLPYHCFDGIQNYNETGTDCGRECPPYKRIIRHRINETDGTTQIIVYNASSICANNIKDKGETDIDCGCHCPPCDSGKTCSVDSDCITSWCYDSICKTPSCSDGLLGPEETKVDCGGSCGECPWIKITEDGFVNETLQIVIMNPRDGLVVRIRGPSMSVTEFNISGIGRQTYYIIEYKPEEEGLHFINLEGYDEKYFSANERTIIDYIPREVRSLLIPLTIVISLVIWYTRRRTKVVIDEKALRHVASNDILTYLIGKYRRVYTVADIQKELMNVKNLIFYELSDSEIDEADELAERYGINVRLARTLILCKKLRAKKLIVGEEIPEEIGNKFEGTPIVSFENEI